MNILDLVVGKPIRTSDERAEQIGPIQEWVLLARGNERIFTVSAPWYIGEQS
jgi:hypothetical protein